MKVHVHATHVVVPLADGTRFCCLSMLLPAFNLPDERLVRALTPEVATGTLVALTSICQ